jgi:hypothetical protein
VLGRPGSLDQLSHHRVGLGSAEHGIRHQPQRGRQGCGRAPGRSRRQAVRAARRASRRRPPRARGRARRSRGTAGDDVTLAVGPSWKVAGGWWPSLGGKSPHLGEGPRFVLVVGTDARKTQELAGTRGDTVHVLGIDGRVGGGVMGSSRDTWAPMPGGGGEDQCGPRALRRGRAGSGGAGGHRAAGGGVRRDRVQGFTEIVDSSGGLLAAAVAARLSGVGVIPKEMSLVSRQAPDRPQRGGGPDLRRVVLPARPHQGGSRGRRRVHRDEPGRAVDREGQRVGALGVRAVSRGPSLSPARSGVRPLDRGAPSGCRATRCVDSGAVRAEVVRVRWRGAIGSAPVL